jgi:hypothetical protein
MLVAVEQWRAYLQHGEFIIFTDQRSLVHITDQRLHTPWQLKLYTKLVGLQYKIVYKPRASNQAADTLSRHLEPPAQLNTISTLIPAWLADVVSGYDRDPSALKLIQELSLAPDSRPPYTLTDGILHLRDHIWIGSNNELKHRLMTALHTNEVGGHSGFPSPSVN